MNFQEAERAYQDLRAQFTAGKLTSSDFEAQVSKLKLQDADGRWWQIGVQSGDWYVHDGQKWAKSKPPAPVIAPAAPSASPEVAVAAPGAAAFAAPPAPAGGSSVKPRFFSAAPAGRGGGLPTPLVIGIIAVVAILGIALLVGGFMFVSGNLGGAAVSKTITPTRVAAVASPVVPTLPPPPPTTAPIVVPTVPVLIPTATATVVITPTAAVTATTAAPRATATKKPAGPTVTPTATATKAPVVAPGVYVTKLVLDPPAPSFNEPIGFKVTVLNTTGQSQTWRWVVKLFRCNQNPCVAEDFKNSFGESTTQQATIPVGTSDLTAPQHVSVGLGACTYVAMPHYFDPVTQQVMPFPQTNGQPMYYVFSLCR